MLYGAPMLAVPEMFAVLVFWTVKARSALVPVVTLPKFVVAVGVTVKSGCAIPLAVPEHVLSFPEVSTAVTRTKYVVPALRAVTPLEMICPVGGVVVDEGTVKNDALGQAGVDVPR
jgi:hypothetical protein